MDNIEAAIKGLEIMIEHKRKSALTMLDPQKTWNSHPDDSASSFAKTLAQGYVEDANNLEYILNLIKSKPKSRKKRDAKRKKR